MFGLVSLFFALVTSNRAFVSALRRPVSTLIAVDTAVRIEGHSSIIIGRVLMCTGRSCIGIRLRTIRGALSGFDDITILLGPQFEIAY